MKSRTLWLVLVAVLSGVGAAGAVIPVHAVWREETTTQVIWNKERAFLVVQEATRGWNGSVGSWLWQMARNVLGASTEGRVSKHRTTIITVGPDGMREFAFDGTSGPVLTVFNGTVYDWIGGTLRKWNGAEFEGVGTEEAQRFTSAKLFTEPNYKDVGGWSSAVNVVMPPERNYRVPLEVGEVHVQTRLIHPRRALQLSWNGKTVWQAEWDSGPRYVGPSEYRQLLAEP